jgi:hypothetical protein
MTGPGHFRAADQPLEHAASILHTDVAPDYRAKLIQRQAVHRQHGHRTPAAPGPPRRSG